MFSSSVKKSKIFADDNKSNVLCDAVQEGNFTTVRNLIENKSVDINSRDEDQRTAFHWACAGGLKEIALYLLEKGAKANVIDESEWTPLISAASAGHAPICKMLLEIDTKENKTNVNAANDSGKTALFYAASKGNMELVQLLIEYNANVNLKDKYGVSPLHRAAGSNSKHSLSIALLLIEHGAKVDAQDSNGDTPLHVAVSFQNSAMASMLFEEKKADANLKNKDGKTPVELALGETKLVFDG